MKKFEIPSKNKDDIQKLLHLHTGIISGLQDGDRYLKVSKDELNHLKDEIGAPNIVLDIGCGLGRSSIYFKNSLKLFNTKFYLADFSSKKWESLYNDLISRKLRQVGYFPNNEILPFTDLNMTKLLCDSNNLTNYEIINLKTPMIYNLRDIDLVYSFNAIGYHLPININIKKYHLMDTTTEDAKFIFGIRKGFVPESIDELNLIKKINGDLFQDYCVYEK